ncbi:hypothetical protein B0H16DRAFT_1663098 [Mycena metata]|uniref:Methyltransferase domain-containing protein n=1 Tax=Mycena metata TaxID=1033252 RepID=A0AAD7NAB2_9AGAR|nr:hypothetical protein B0H16DRAFT_1663098 [Mycena metata]
MAPAATDAPESYEETHVHDVYDAIASHFSSTRYKPWPIIAAFLANLQDGWVGLDSGTGNGKYLPLPLDRPGRQWTIGLDRSRNLLEIARTCWRSGRAARSRVGRRSRPRLATRSFRVIMCARTGLRNLNSYDPPSSDTRKTKTRSPALVGRRLSRTRTRADICVGDAPGRAFKAKHPHELERDGQDVFVPWVLAEDSTQVFNRYYHMFDDGELAALVSVAAEELGLVIGPAAAEGSLKGVEIVQGGWERSNHFVELRRWQT